MSDYYLDPCRFCGKFCENETRGCTATAQVIFENKRKAILRSAVPTFTTCRYGYYAALKNNEGKIIWQDGGIIYHNASAAIKAAKAAGKKS